MKNLKVCWISAGVSSFIAGYILKDEIDKFIYIDIENQHPDSLRFINDCSKVLGKDIEILKPEYKNVQNVIETFRFINSPYGAKCTQVLKKRTRKEWEDKHKEYNITYIWGFDNKEKHRADRLVDAMSDFNHIFPLIDYNISKNDAHAMCETLGIRRPLMYDLGYPNNCIGCVKGGMGYWNKIRVDFPEVFNRMAKLERQIGASCIKGIYLDELDVNRGRGSIEVLPECGIGCEMLLL